MQTEASIETISKEMDLNLAIQFNRQCKFQSRHKHMTNENILDSMEVLSEHMESTLSDLVIRIDQETLEMLTHVAAERHMIQ